MYVQLIYVLRQTTLFENALVKNFEVYDNRLLM